MKPRNILEVKGKATTAALALALFALPAIAADPDGHAFVRDSILNTWTPTAVASPTDGKIDPHERARITIVGASKFPSATGVTTLSNIDAHEQARRLLLAQPVVSRQPVVASDRTRSGS